MPGVALSFFGLSATMAFVVIEARRSTLHFAACARNLGWIDDALGDEIERR
jgi:hypothetical protein